MAPQRLRRFATLFALDDRCPKLPLRRAGRDPAAGRRLVFEACEERSMLSGGTISGTITGGGATTVSLYVDTNDDGVFDAGDLLATTTSVNPQTPSGGTFSFANLADDRYFVNEQVAAGFTQTGGPSHYTVDVVQGVASSLVDNFNFANDPGPYDAFLINGVNSNPQLFTDHDAASVGNNLNILGADRTTLVNVLATAPNPAQGNSASGFIGDSSGNTELALTTPSGLPGTSVTLQYDGTNTAVQNGSTNALTVPTAVLLGDLTNFGTNSELLFDFSNLQGQGVATIQMAVTAADTFGDAFTTTVQLTQTGPVLSSTPVLFSAFTGVDFTHLARVTVQFNGNDLPAVNLQLNDIDGANPTSTGYNFTNSATTGLQITKTDDHGGSSVSGVDGTVTPGGSLTYTINPTNPPSGSVTGDTISDPLPIGFTPTVFPAWLTETGTAGTGFTLSGTIPSGGTPFTIAGTISSTAAGTLVNTVSVTQPGDGNSVTATATDTDNLLTIIKADNHGGSSVSGAVGTVAPGGTLTYDINPQISGTGSLTGDTISDTLPAGFTPTAGGYPAWLTLSGNTLSGTIPSGATIPFTVTGTVSLGATAGLTNTVTVTALNGGSTGTTSATATESDNLLTISKIDDHGGSSVTGAAGTVTPGGTLIYTIDPAITGAGSLTGDTVTDTLPAGFTPTAGGYPAWLTLTGNTLSGTIPSGATIPFTVSGTVSLGATGTLTNTVSVESAFVSEAQQRATASASESDNLLTITKIDDHGGSSITDTVGTVTPGGTLTYTIDPAITGNGTLTGDTISDTLPAEFTPTAGGYPAWLTLTGNTLTGTIPAGGTPFTVTGTVSSGATTGLTNTVTVTALNGGTTETTSATATESDNLLTITKTDDHGGSSITGAVGTVTPGGTLTYTIDPENTSGSVVGDMISDTLPAGFTPTAGGYPAWLTLIGNTLTGTIPAGGTPFTVTGTVSSGATSGLTNTVTVTALNGGTTETTSATATESDNLLTITKTDDHGGSSITGAVGTVSPGGMLTYTINPAITGSGTVTGDTISDTLPAGFTPTAGGYPAWLTLSGNTLTGTIPAGGTPFTVSGTISSGATGTLTNTVIVTALNGGTTETTSAMASDSDTVGGAVSSLSGYVYVDPTNSGVKVPGDPGIGGVIIDIYDSSNTLISQTTTNSAGAYGFSNLGAGSYKLVEKQPINFIEGKTTVGSQGGTEIPTQITTVSIVGGTNGVNNNFAELGLQPAYINKGMYLFSTVTQPVTLTAVYAAGVTAPPSIVPATVHTTATVTPTTVKPTTVTPTTATVHTAAVIHTVTPTVTATTTTKPVKPAPPAPAKPATAPLSLAGFLSSLLKKK